MSTHLSYLNYIKSLAEQHKDIRHDDRNKPGFATMNFTRATTTVLQKDGPILQASEVEGRFTGDSDSLTPLVRVGFLVWVKHPKDNASAEDAAFDESLRIGYEILARIINDAEEGCNALSGFDPGTVTFEMVEALGTWAAYWFQFTLRDHNISIDYSEDVWQ